MSKLRILLLGVLLGQLIMAPTIYNLFRTPKIETEILFAEDFFQHSGYTYYTIDNVPNVRYNSNAPLKITITSEENVLKEHQKRWPSWHPDPGYTLLGFWDEERHEVWSTNSVPVLIHELRHVFERYFHRG